MDEITVKDLQSAMLQHLKEDKEFQDRLEKKLDEHIAKVEPFLQGAAGFSILWKVAVAIGGLLVVWVQVKGLFFK